MKIYICSDIHNNFSRFVLQEPVDLVLCAGDITNYGRKESYKFDKANQWLDSLSNYGRIPVLYVPGNHDIGWEFHNHNSFGWNLLGKEYRNFENNLIIAGASMSVCYKAPDLATFWDNMTCNPEVEKAYYESIPRCDVLLSHSPPSGDLGFCTISREDYGSVELRSWIERHQPKLVVCGHIHDPLSREEFIGCTRVINTAIQSQIIEL
jgi:uncharacterized protein